MQKLKVLDINQKSFSANGNEYFISTGGLSVNRWRKFEDLQALVGFGRSFEDVFKQVKRAYEALQHPKIADASVFLHNILTGIKEKLEKRHHPALLMCALFINQKDENIAEYSEEIMNEKIKDWQEEGYDVNGFFQLAWNFIPGFIESFSDVSEGISSPLTKKKSETSKQKK